MTEEIKNSNINEETKPEAGEQRFSRPVKRLLMGGMKGLYLVVLTGIFAWLWVSHYMALMPVRYFYRGNIAIVGIYLVLLWLFNRAFGALKIGHLKTWDVLYSQIFAVLCTNGTIYVVLLLIHGSWAMFRGFTPVFEEIGPILLMTALDIFIFLIWAITARNVYAWLYPPHELLLIYGSSGPEDLITTLRKRSDRYCIRESISMEEGTDRIMQKMSAFDAVMVGDVPSHERNRIIKYAFEKNIRCYCIPKISDIMIRSADGIELFDTPILLFRNDGLSLTERFLKRAVDIIVSLLALVPFSIIMAAVAAAIWLDDRGPLFYTQERLTTNGRVFSILKFRSMIVSSESESGARLASAEDDRITRVGKVIRRLHFDELPQLFNILKGDMSLVGPRPERPDIAAAYRDVIPEFDYRLKVKAGLTGYAQVYGQYNTKPYDKLKLDLNYIENYSLWLDFKLMLLTIKILFQKEKSVGVDASKKTAL